MLVNVYLPTDCSENYDKFCEYSDKIDDILYSYDILQSVITPYVMAIGDFNAHPGAKFGQELFSFADENGYIMADLIKLTFHLPVL